MSEQEQFVDSLREAFYALRRLSERMLADLECTPVERGVLTEIAKHGPRPVPVMARFRAISRQAMQKTVDGMIERRWLCTEANPEHARSPLIALTPAGMKVWETIRRREASLLAGDPPVSEGELARTTAVLRKMKPYFEELS